MPGRWVSVTSIIVLLLLAVSTPAQAHEDGLTSRDSVDTSGPGMEIRWGGNTQYKVERDWAIMHALGRLVIAPDDVRHVEDLRFQDVNLCSVSARGWWDWDATNADELVLNICVMKNLSDDQKKKTVTHEMGHALRLDENNFTVPIQVMKQANTGEINTPKTMTKSTTSKLGESQRTMQRRLPREPVTLPPRCKHPQ